MAPELLSEDEPPYSFASDVYGYGLVLWEMTIHQHPKIPFEHAKNPALLMKKIIMGPPEPIPAATPLYFSNLIEQCRIPTLSDRPSTAKIIEDLNAADEAVVTPTPTQEIVPGISRLDISGSTSGISSASSHTSGLLFFSDVIPSPAPILVPKPQPQIIIPSPVPKPQPQINPCSQQELAKFLKHVGFGEQGYAEQMLKANPSLALAKGDLTDCADRQFPGITGFQYALWALDYYMWNMILKYMPRESQVEQVQEYEASPWRLKHDSNLSWSRLIEAYDTLIKNWSNWNGDRRDKHWCQQIGGTQIHLPAHLIQEYLRTDLPLYNGRTFIEPNILPRNDISTWRNPPANVIKPEYTLDKRAGCLETNFAYGWRAGMPQGRDRWGMGGIGPRNLKKLLELRSNQRTSLMKELAPVRRPRLQA